MTETSPGGADARQGGRRAQGRLLRQAGAAYRSADRAARRQPMPRSANSASSGSRDRTSRPATGTGRTPTSPPSPTAGCTPATPRGSTRKASTTSSTAGRTCTSPAARTSIRPRSRTCCTSSPPIAEAAVIGIPSEQWGEIGMAIIAVKPGHTLTRGGNPRALRGQPRALQAPAPDRVRRRPAAQCHRQDPQADVTEQFRFAEGDRCGR